MAIANRSGVRPSRVWVGARRAALVVASALIAATLHPLVAGAQVSASGPDCVATRPDGPVFITADCTDPGLTTPYTDVDEQRTTTDPVTKVKVSYRYIHGGFKDTKSTFSFYFPPKAKYQGRFFEQTYPTVSKDDALPHDIVFGISNGAYVVSTNNNGGLPGGGVLAGYRTNAAAAKYSREVAKKVYGTTDRPRGYIFGASGGAYQTLASAENTEGVYDGTIPMVSGTSNSIPSFMTVQLLASRILGNALPKVVDALEPGGSGDPYAGLTIEQRAALEEATKLGFPQRGWWQYATLDGGGFLAVEGGIEILDSTYADNFWSLPGYEGSDPAVAAARVQHDTTVQKVAGKGPVTLTLADVPPGDYVGADLVMNSGASAGKKVMIANVTGKEVEIAGDADSTVTGALAVGDQVRLDNSWNIAMQYYQRHQVPAPDQYGWNQYRSADGAPAEPQRDRLIGEFFVKTIGGSVATGNFHGKMIMLSSLLDVQAFPWPADWYKMLATASRGADTVSSDYRLWFMDNSDHDPFYGSTGPASTHIVPYSGEFEQALLDLDAWVKEGTSPAASTSYTVGADTQLTVPATAAERNGLQPTVTVGAGNGGTNSVEVTAGKAVRLSAKAAVPPGGGKIVRVEWDFDGTGKYPEKSEIGSPAATKTATATHTFAKPGTYFVAVRVTAERNGDPKEPYRQVQNLARARVVVK